MSSLPYCNKKVRIDMDADFMQPKSCLFLFSFRAVDLP